MKTMIKECAGIDTVCTCALKDDLLQQLIELHSMKPHKERRWFEALRGSDARIGEHTPCCLIIYLCYYGYFEESFLSVSEHARRSLDPIMKPN